MKQTFVDKCFKDKSGTIVIGQKPNIPIIIWLTTLALRIPALPLRLETGIAFIGTGFLFTWAWLELSSGVNYLRRALGLAVLLFIIITEFM